MVFEGIKTWTKIGAVVPPGTVRRIRLTITEVDGANFKGVYSAGDNEPTTWSWKASGEYGRGKIKWSDELGGQNEGKLEGEMIEFDSGNGVGKMKLVVRP